MKAVQMAEHGGPEVLKYQDVADPQPGEGQALVQIEAAGVNFTDVYTRAGVNPSPSLPWIIGLEAAGTVRGVGPGVTEVKEGGLGRLFQYPRRLCGTIRCPFGEVDKNA